MIKNIFFDFNGTILNDTDLCFDIEDKMLKKYNLPPVTLDFYLDNFKFPVKNYYELVGYDFNKYDYHKISEEFMNEYFARYKKETYLYKGVEDLFKKLKKEGFKLYVLSATKEDELVKQLRHLGVSNYFEAIIGTKDNLAKGKIEFAKDFIKNKNINVEESIMIGDTIHDYEVGVSIGFKTYLMTTGHNSKKLLKTVSDDLFDNYEDLYKFIKNVQ